jgi:hypothetical protein
MGRIPGIPGRKGRQAAQWRPKTPEELGYKPAAVAGAGEEPTARGGGKVAATSKKNKARQ